MSARGKKLSRWLAVVLAAGLAGCATVPRDAGFDDVRQTVAERGGYDVRWYGGTSDDAAAAEAVRQLLADSLTMEEAVQVALLNNRRLQATYEELGIAQAAVVQAGLLRNPIFGARMAFHADGGVADVGLNAAVEFLDVFYIPLRKAVAKAAFEGAKLRVAGAVLDLAADVRTAFLQVQAAEQAVEMRRAIAQAAEAGYDAARRLHAAGNIRRFDLQNEQALFEQTRLDLAAAELALDARREQLNRLLGVWGADTAWRVTRRLPAVPDVPVDLDEIEARAVDVSLDLAIARQEIELYGRRLGVERATALVPDLEVEGEAEWEEGEWKAGPGLALPIPLFDQGQARRAAARAELRRRQSEYVAVAVDVRAAARSLRQRLTATRRMALHYRDVVLPLRAAITQEAQLQYNAMQIGVFQLLETRQEEIQAGQRFIEALEAYWLARTELDLLLQGRLPRGNEAALPSSGSNSAEGSNRDGGH